MEITLNGYYTLILATLVLLLGRFLVKRIKFLEDFNIPEPVAGGLVAAIVVYILNIVCPLKCEQSKYTPDERLNIFKRHMPRVLKAIIGGDLDYIKNTPDLLDADNHIYYSYSEDNKVFESMGIVKEYI